MATSIKNVSDQERDLPVGNMVHSVEPGDTVEVPDALAEQLLEQPDNWGTPTEPTRDELAEEFVEESIEEAAGMSRTDLQTALSPEPVEPPRPKTVNDFKAALEAAQVDFPSSANKADLVQLYNEHVEGQNADEPSNPDADAS